MRPVLALLAAVVLATSCGNGESEGTASPEVYDVVLLGDTLAQRDWVPVWADLIETDLGVGVRLEQLAVGNPIDYDKVLADQDVREALAGAELVFISPEPDYLVEACPPGTSDAGCVEQFVADYRASWSQWLDEIQDLSNDAPIRSAKAWAWVVPPEARPAILFFMDEMGAETIEHGGLVADLNAAFTGEDYQGDPPADWVDDFGHPLGPANEVVARLIQDLGDGTDG